jgi:hypothetical protein
MKSKYLVITLSTLAMATPAFASIALNSSRSNVARVQTPAPHQGKSAIDNWSSRARGTSSDSNPIPQDRRVHSPITIVRPH